MKKNLKEKFKNVRIVFMDVDGVLNDGRIFFSSAGEESKTWYVRDRLGIKILKSTEDLDVKVIWISGRSSKELKEVGDELRVDEVFSGIDDKVKIMNEVLSQYNIESLHAMYIGDDIVDLSCMEKAGISCCPLDAAQDVKVHADFVSSYKGGKGAVREIIEEILRAKGIWEGIVADYKETL